jgi:hypothetical protein
MASLSVVVARRVIVAAVIKATMIPAAASRSIIGAGAAGRVVRYSMACVIALHTQNVS